jgi:hypothetical protein
MYIPGKAQIIANEMKAYEISILGIAEGRWNEVRKHDLRPEKLLYTLDTWRKMLHIRREWLL